MSSYRYHGHNSLLHADATGIGISPRIFNTGPLGAGVIAEAININPALLYIAQSGYPNVAVGYSVVSNLSFENRPPCCVNLAHEPQISCFLIMRPSECI